MLRIAVLTSMHFITGEVDPGGQRLSDYLGNLLLATVKLTDGAIARIGEPNEAVARHDELMIPGRDIVLGFEQLPRATSARSGPVVQKHPHSVFLVSDPVEIEGTVHALSATHLDMKEMLTTLADRFLPVTDATVTICAGQRYRLRLPAVMVNARRLGYMARSSPEADEREAAAETVPVAYGAKGGATASLRDRLTSRPPAALLLRMQTR